MSTPLTRAGLALFVPALLATTLATGGDSQASPELRSLSLPTCNSTTADLVTVRGPTAGTVDISTIADTLIIEYSTAWQWDLWDVDFHVACDLNKVPTTRLGNPKVQDFDYRYTLPKTTKSGSWTVDLDDLECGCDEQLYVVAHALVEGPIPGRGRRAVHAWADGVAFGSSSRATAVPFTPGCCDGDTGDTGFSDTGDTGACEGIDFGDAGDYNILVFDDYTDGVDVLGKVAAGGDLDMAWFSVARDDPGGDAVVAGDDLSLTDGTVWGDAAYGGSATIDSSVNFQSGGAATSGSPLDFVTIEQELEDLSLDLEAEADNGSVSTTSWGASTLTGSASGLNVFDVSASTATTTNTWNISAPAGSVVVINVSGASVFLGYAGINLSGVDATDVIWNFPDATDLELEAIGLKGTVLAPFADVVFNNGHFDGGLYARSLTGNAEGHYELFDGDPCD